MASESLPSAASLSREEIAHREVGHTTIAPGTARGLVAAFLVLITLPAVLQFTRTARGEDGTTTSPWSHLGGIVAGAESAAAQAGGAGATWWSRVVAANRSTLSAIEAFEDGLEEDAWFARVLRPHAQTFLTGVLGVGNERVYRGRDGWLFYRPDVEYVTGPGFLAPEQLARRVAGASEWVEPPQPDPREALVAFSRQLGSRGVALVVVPVPVKPTVEAGQLSARVDPGSLPLQNPSFDTFLRDLRRAGVTVFDVSPVLLEHGRGTGRPPYLETDTHWTPASMQHVAERLAAFLRAEIGLQPMPDPGFRVEERNVSNLGDIALMLDLPEGQQLYPPESVLTQRVLGPDGQPWRPSRSADVLVLGDSFSNIYSLGSMGWGESAGFVEHLSRALGRPVDRIVQNDDGAFATRERLRRDLATGTDRLAGKRVVIHQFATRELAFGDWRRFELPLHARASRE